MRSKLLWLISLLTRQWKLPGIERFVRWVCPPEGKTGHIQTTLRYQKTLLIKVDTANFIEWGCFFFGDYEPEITELLKQHLQRGDVAWDVGANIGVHTLVMANQVGQAGRVISVEPHPKTFQRLLEHIRMNQLGNVAALPIALGASPGRVKLHLPHPESSQQGSATLRPASQNSHPSSVEVELKTLDEVATAENITRCDLIKIDSEGSDLHILQGGSRTITSFRPTIIFEYQAAFWYSVGSRLDQAKEWLSQLGFDLFLVRGRGEMLIPLGEPPWPESCNILAMPKQSY